MDVMRSKFERIVFNVVVIMRSRWDGEKVFLHDHFLDDARAEFLGLLTNVTRNTLLNQ